MPEEILKNLFRITVPLPNNPLRELNSYLIKGSDRNILIDTGFRQQPCREALFAGLQELGARREDTDVLLTHLHSDHAGLAPEVVGEGHHIYVSDVDRVLLESYQNQPSGVRDRDRLFIEEGFSPELVAQISTSNPAHSMAPQHTTYTGLLDGDVVEVGGYKLTCVLTPGHTPGQMCYWMEKEGLMFLGDHVLFDITPNITAWMGVTDSLGDYMESLKVIRPYPVAVPLPGHRARGPFQPRVDALLEHHALRLEEALAAVRRYPGLPAYELAGYMTWKIRSDSWETFPLAQKWFAVGECAAHMDHLVANNQLTKTKDEHGVMRYFAV